MIKNILFVRREDMLLELHIHNLAIIEDISLNFNNGMTVLTGETGAGKSIIIDAVSLLSGGRGSADFVRHGVNKCILEGHFTMPNNQELIQLFEQEAIEIDPKRLIIQREIYQNGRSVCRVNGSIVTIATLKNIGSYLIDIHGQNEHQELMQNEDHIYLLDHFGKEKVTSLLNEYQRVYQQYKETLKLYNEWQEKEQEIAQKIDILRFQTNEIEEAHLLLDEEEELEEEERRLTNFQNIMEALTMSYQVLQEGEPSVIEMLGIAMDEMKDVADVDQALEDISETLSNSFYQLQEVASEIYRQLDLQEYDENRLNEIASRLNLIQQLKRKYGNSIPEILDFYENAKRELSLIVDGSKSITELGEQLNNLKEELYIKGEQLSKERRVVAKELEQAIHEQLEALYMDKVVFVVEFKDDFDELSVDSASKMGLDSVEFYISTNPGEPLKPLTRIASGGELSRMMLAMKTIFAQAQGITSIIFDEIDTGVSGRVAQAIAEKIYSISLYSQVLCITHLPQVAAIANNHLYVRKEIIDDKTTTEASILSENERVEELARMLSGSETTKAAVQAAMELRENAKTIKS